MKSPLRALYVDLNSFFASCEQQENPRLRRRPVAVVPMLTDSTFVIAASYEAKAFGVKTGVRVGDAKKMCPDLILVAAKHGPYVQYHHKVKAAIDTIMPIHSVCSIDEFACELTGTQQQPEKALNLAEKIRQAIYEIVGSEICCSIGISTNFLLAKMACDMKKPNGLTLLDDKNREEKLRKLPLQDVPGIGPRMAIRLQRAQVKTLSDLLDRSERETRALWGSILGSRYHRLLNGEWLTSPPQKETQSMSHQHILPPNLRNEEGGRSVAHKLLWKAAIRLRSAGFLAQKMSLSVRMIDRQRFSQEVRFEPSQDSSFLLNQINIMYDKIWDSLGKKQWSLSSGPVEKVSDSRRSSILRSEYLQLKPMKISVVLWDFVNEKAIQLSLFDQPENPESMNTNSGQLKRQSAFRAVDAINEKFGRDTIYAGSLHQQLQSAPTRIAFSRIPELSEVSELEENPPQENTFQKKVRKR